jgi:hypothetical protein
VAPPIAPWANARRGATSGSPDRGEPRDEGARSVLLGSRHREEAFQGIPSRAHHDEPRQQRHLGVELGRLRCDQQRTDQGDARCEGEPRHAPRRHGLGIGDHEEEEDQHLGRRDDHPPEPRTAHRRERPAGRHAMS